MATPKESKTSILEKRLSRLELHVGYNEDGTKNGNGLIHKIEEVKEEIKNLGNNVESYDTYLDKLSEDFIKIDLRIERIENHVKDFIAEIQTYKNKRDEELKEIKKSLEGNINIQTLHNIQKAVVGIAGFIAAMGTILGAIFYFTK